MTAGEWRVEHHEHLLIAARDVEDDNGRGVTEHLCQNGTPVMFASESAAGAIVSLLNSDTIAPLNQDRRRLRLEIRYRHTDGQNDEAAGFVSMLERLTFVESVEVVE